MVDLLAGKIPGGIPMAEARLSSLGWPSWPWDSPAGAMQQRESREVLAAMVQLLLQNLSLPPFAITFFLSDLCPLKRLSQLPFPSFISIESCPAPAQPAAQVLSREALSGTLLFPPSYLISPGYPALAALRGSGCPPHPLPSRGCFWAGSPTATQALSTEQRSFAPAFGCPPFLSPFPYSGSEVPNAAGAEGQAGHTGAC